jgi:hypothetical protein
MKRVLILVILFSNYLVSASEGEDNRIIMSPYSVISDSLDTTIEKDHYLLSGNVKMFSSTNPLENVLIGSTASGTWTRSGSTGAFSITLKSSDQTIYFYKESWTEVVIEDYIFKERHHVIMDVYMNQVSSENYQLKRKPVIYLYAEKELTASVKLNPYGEFTFTYPEYNNGWDVTVKVNGGIKVNDKSYPYLFWEAKSSNLMIAPNETGYQIPGFIINSDTASSFLQNTLEANGLNQTEITDFITYWGPILERKEYAFIQFILDEQYDTKVAELKISPQVNCSKRVYILCSNLTEPSIGMDVVPQSFNSFERKGFTIVEWGGSILDINNL